MKSVRQQIPFDFAPHPALGGKDFLCAPCNADALAWVERWPHWPGGVLSICGPRGSGKTHLAHVFQHVSGAVLVDAQALAKVGADHVLEGCPAVVLENMEHFLQTFSAPSLEEELLHLYNLAREAEVRILMTSVAAPARWQIALKDLSSRLNTAQVAEIRMPDDALLTALIAKQFADRQLKVERDVLAYMASRMERSFAGVQALVQTIDKAALSQQRAITIPLVRRVLDEF